MTRIVPVQPGPTATVPLDRKGSDAGDTAGSFMTALRDLLAAIPQPKPAPAMPLPEPIPPAPGDLGVPAESNGSVATAVIDVAAPDLPVVVTTGTSDAPVGIVQAPVVGAGQGLPAPVIPAPPVAADSDGPVAPAPAKIIATKLPPTVTQATESEPAAAPAPAPVRVKFTLRQSTTANPAPVADVRASASDEKLIAPAEPARSTESSARPEPKEPVASLGTLSALAASAVPMIQAAAPQASAAPTRPQVTESDGTDAITPGASPASPNGASAAGGFATIPFDAPAITKGTAAGFALSGSDATPLAAPAASLGGVNVPVAPTIVAVEARWLPFSANPTPGAVAGASPAAEGDTVVPSADDGATGIDAPPPPAELARLIASVVREVTHAGTNGSAAAVGAHARHGSGSAAEERQRDNAIVAAHPADSTDLPGFAPVPVATAATSRPAVNGSELADPGPRTLPEPKEAPAPTAHATIELDAAKTGASRIRIAVQGDQVRATITASDAGLASLDRQLPELRRSLEERGFSDVRLAVRAQQHAGSAASVASSATDDARSFTRERPHQQAQRSTQHDSGERAGSQRRRRDPEEEQ